MLKPADTAVETDGDFTSPILLLLLLQVEPGPGVGTSGQIAKVRLENFMCHDNWEMKFTYACSLAFVYLDC